MSHLAIPHLESFWRRKSARDGSVADARDQRDWVNDNTLLCGLNLGLQETLYWLNQAHPTLEQFEQWIIEKNGGVIDAALVNRINDGIAGCLTREAPKDFTPVLSADDLSFWDANGYVILHDAVDPADCRAAAVAIYEFLGATPDDPDSWYRPRDAHSIWLPVMHAAPFVANRYSPRIHAAFTQLWGRSDLWVNTDQCGFNPPERDDWKFPGPCLHWDMSLALPLSFGTQAILYLTDTHADQGAFQCVPGFHHKLDSWLRALPAGEDPRQADFSAFAKPIAGAAGDLVIWNQMLPHGSSPNRSTRPRVVQYLNLRPSQWDFNPVWK